MKYIRTKAYGKLNLALDITGRRPDGYHEVRMIMQTVNVFDRLLFEKTGDGRIEISTNKRFIPTDESNIIYKAIDLLRNEYGIIDGIRVVLDKHIPVAAGMAGGSADAAATLKAMDRLFDLGLSREKLMEYGVRLGADVPYCILGGTALSEGIGEKLTELSQPPACKILIVKPKESASTKIVYSKYDEEQRNYHPNVDEVIKAINAGDLRAMADSMGNVLEEVTAKDHPIIYDIEEKMRKSGALKAIMTGSGTTVFGIFEKDAQIGDLVDSMKTEKSVRQVFLTEFI